MEYRRRYFRRFGNQNQEEKSQSNLVQNQKEEKTEPSINDKKINTQNVYLQKLLQKTNNVRDSSNIAITSVNDNLPSFKNNIHDILSTDENKQRAIKYVIQKRNEGKRVKLQINTENDQEESNPVLANRYTHYQNRNNLNKNNSNVAEVYNKYTNVNTGHNAKKEEMQQDIKPPFSHYYARRTKQPSNITKEPEIQPNKNIEENNNENRYRGRKIQMSVSTNNMLNSPKASQPFEKDEKVVVKKERYYNINSYRNNNTNNIKETEEPKPRYKYLRGYVKRFEEEQNEKNNIKEKEEEVNVNNKQPKEVSVNLNIGKNFSFGIKDLYNNSSKSFGNQNSLDNIISEESHKFKGYKYFKIVKNNFELGQKNKKDVYTKKFAFSRQKDKSGDNKKDIVREKVIDFKLLGNPNNNTNNVTNTEAPVSRFRRKYGRYTSNNNIENTNNTQNLTFKDENEIITFLNKKYTQEKLIDLFKIKFPEDEKNKKELINPINNDVNIKELQDKLAEEKRKNEENIKKLKQLESSIGEQTNEIRDKNIGIGKKIQEIDKLKNDITSFKKDLQSKEKENIKLKNELEQTIKTEGNKQNKLKEELDKIKKNYDSLIIENEKNVKDYNELLNENEQNKNDYNDLLKDFESLQSQSAELIEIKKSKEELDLNYSKTTEENIKLKTELDNLKKDHEKNKEQLEIFKTENEKLKGEMNIVNNLNDKLIEDNGKIKEEIKNTNSNLEKNKQQNLELNKTKDKYYKLLDDYKQLTRDCNILRDEKTSNQIEQKQLLHNYKIAQDENAKLQNDYTQLKELYDKLISELNINNKSKVQIPKSILKKSDNKTIEIEKDITSENKIEEENPTYKTIVIENTKNNKINLNLDNKENENDKVVEIKNTINDVNNNVNDINKKVNMIKSISSLDKKEQKDTNVKFNINEQEENKSINDQEKNKLDEEKKNIRLSKAMLRIKKKQESNENNSQIKLNKSLKVQDLVKELENNMQKRDMASEEKEEVNGGNEIQVENGANVVNVLDNQQLTKSMKKKKKAKQFDDGEN